VAVTLLTAFAHIVARRRRWIIGAWIVLTLFGAFSASQVSKRWYQSFSIPGKPAYEANQRTFKAFGTGVRPPNVVVFHTSGDASKSDAIRAAMLRVAGENPGARTSSWFSTHNAMYLSKDRHTAFMEVYPPGLSTFSSTSNAKEMRAAATAGLPAGIQVEVTGHDPLEEASSKGGGGKGNILVEAMVGGVGALIILFFVFGTLPAVLMPIAVAAAAILNTHTLVWGLT
jgi:RND superfamily putative drug exporter